MDPISIIVFASSLIVQTPKPLTNIEENVGLYGKTIQNLEKIECQKRINDIICDINKKNKSLKN